jgi:hypothetical protein
MGEIEEADKEIGYAQEKEVPVVMELAGIPGNDENSEGDDDAEELCQGMEKKKVIEGAEIKKSQDKGKAQDIAA